jgi:hypothetical protein
MDVNHIRADWHRRLADTRRKIERTALIAHTAGALVALLLFLLVSLILEDLLLLPGPVRALLFWLFMLSAAALVSWRIAPHVGRLFGILKNEDDVATARRVGRLPEVRDRLVNALQLLAGRETQSGTSGELVDASLILLAEELEPIDFSSIVDRSQAHRSLKRLAGLTLAAVLVAGIFPSPLSEAAFRLLHYEEVFAAPAPFAFVVHPGDVSVVKGERVTLRITTEGMQVKTVSLTMLREGETIPEVQQLAPGPDGDFSFTVAAIHATTRYRAEAGGVRSREYRIRVLDRPAVRLMRCVLQPPAYTRIPPQTLDENIGDISAIVGTRVEVTVDATSELRQAELVFGDGKRVSLSKKARAYAGSFAVMRNGSYHVELVDTAGTPSADPVEYSVKAQPDAFPTVAVVKPGANIDVTDNATVPMLVKVADDFGFSAVKLEYRLMQSRFETASQDYTSIILPTPSDHGGEVLIPYLWDLSPLHLAPEDVIGYRIAVSDNDAVSGPKTAWSETYTLRLPSLDEVFADADKKQESSLGDMSDALKKAEEARKDLEELQHSLQKESAKMDWQQKAKAEEVLKKYEAIQKSMDDVRAQIEQTAAEMQNNQVLSAETMQKYAELQHLMSEINSPEFAEAMKKLQESMEQLTPEAMRKAMEQFSFSEENFRKSIERTMNLLKRVQIEQKMDELVKRAEELKSMEETLANRTDSLAGAKDNAAELQRMQQEAQRQLNALEQQARELQKKMEEFPSEMPLAEMTEANQDLEQSGLQDQMDKIGEQLSGGKNHEASEQQRAAAAKLKKAAQQFRKVQDSLRDRQQKQVINAMRKAARDLLELSDRQETLKDQTKNLDPSSQRFRDLQQQQMDLMNDLSGVTNRISGLSQKTFGVTPEMGKSLGDAMRSMAQSMQSLDQRNGSMAGTSEGDAMGSLNAGASQLQSMANAMAQQSGSGGSGMMGLFPRLQRMGGQQQSINEGTKNLGGMAGKDPAELGRLAAEQGMVRKSLEQLAKEAAQSGELKKLLGDLNRAAQEMREVQTDLAGGSVSGETLRRQDRILSRLLDAQRSAQERDFDKERKAAAGKDVPRVSPNAIDLTTQDGRNRLRRDLERALEEGYARDYQELIKRYFEALELQESTPR